MTDYPRFQWIDGDPSDSHRYYHGAPVVNLVLRVADWWLNLSSKHRRETCVHGAVSGEIARCKNLVG